MGWQSRIKRARRYIVALNTGGAQPPNVTPPARDLVVIRRVAYKTRMKIMSRHGIAHGMPSFAGIEAAYLAGRKSRAVKRTQVKAQRAAPRVLRRKAPGA